MKVRRVDNSPAFFIIFPTPILMKTKTMLMRFGFGMLLATLLVGCTGDVQKRRNADDPVSESEVREALEEFDVDQYFPGNKKDSLLVNMVTYIYRRPAKAKAADRTKPEYRSYYIRSAELFEYIYHYKNEDDIHYFYLIRPARSLEHNYRAVGGKFTVNEDLELLTFEEIFNTTIMDLPDLKEKGLILFEEMISEGNVERFLPNQNLIEWPDHRLKYNKDQREWQYVN